MYEGPKPSSEEPLEKVVNDPLVVLRAIRHEIMRTGSVDSEGDELDLIEEAYKNGEIDGATAIEKAKELRDRRQDYH